MPQIWQNYRTKSVDGLALPFLLNWLCGDITNLIGCILTKQLPFQRNLAIYFNMVDLILLLQYGWYGKHSVSEYQILEEDPLIDTNLETPGKRWHRHRKQLSPVDLEHTGSWVRKFTCFKSQATQKATSVDGLAISNDHFQEPRHSEPAESNVTSTFDMSTSSSESSLQPDGYDCSVLRLMPELSAESSTRNSNRRPSSLPIESLSQIGALNLPGRSALSFLTTRRITCPMLLFSAFVLLAFNTHHFNMVNDLKLSVQNVRAWAGDPTSISRISNHFLRFQSPNLYPHPSPEFIASITPKTLAPTTDWKEAIGRLSAWICALLYLTSRLPQIWKNYSRKSVEGLSMLLFIMAFLGNLTYVISALSSPSMSTNPSYMIDSIPYLIGSGGTLCFDMAIYIQSFLYRPRERRNLHSSQRLDQYRVSEDNFTKHRSTSFISPRHVRKSNSLPSPGSPAGFCARIQSGSPHSRNLCHDH